jgi:hypothetical protein
MNSAIKSGSSNFRQFWQWHYIICTCYFWLHERAEVCDYDGVCLVNETDNCADCKDVLGRDVEDATGNVIYFNDLNV